MELVVATLADAAVVRDELLFVLGGGISKLTRPTYPALFNTSVAMSFEASGRDYDRDHELEIRILAKDGNPIGELKGKIRVTRSPEDKRLFRQIPGTSSVVAGLNPLVVPLPGLYRVEISLNRKLLRTLNFIAIKDAKPSNSTK